MNLSVIIPTKNRKGLLLECIRSIMEQTHLPEELIIVDQSEESEERLLRNNVTWEHVKFIYIWDINISGLTAARNTGISKASGDVILFLDDDVVLEADYIVTILDIYRKDFSKEIGGVGGLITNFNFTSFWGNLSKVICRGPWKNHYDFWYRKGEGLLSTHFLSGCNMSYRKEVLDRFKFDERLTGICMGEDRFFSYQVSKYFKLYMVAGAKLQHKVSPVSRNKERNLRSLSIYSNYYFYKNYVDKTFYNIFCYSLNMFGNAFISLLSGNKERIIGTYSALAKIIMGKYLLSNS
ncbi:MAG: glycosyltransferase family 2 protein [Nitrospirota bacterium]